MKQTDLKIIIPTWHKDPNITVRIIKKKIFRNGIMYLKL